MELERKQTDYTFLQSTDSNQLTSLIMNCSDNLIKTLQATQSCYNLLILLSNKEV